MNCLNLNFLKINNFENLNTNVEIENFNQKVVEIAQIALKELAVSLICATITIFFVVSTSSIAIVYFGAIITPLVNAALRYFSEKYLLIEKIKQGNLLDLDRQFKQGIHQYICPIISAIQKTTTIGIFIHELGHALSATLLISNIKAHIEIFPVSGGVTRFTYPRYPLYSELSKRIGISYINPIIAAAGTANTLIFSLPVLAIAQKLRKSHPLLSNYLRAFVVLEVFGAVIYSLSALWPTKLKGHDFNLLALAGIHPIVATITILAIPVLFQIGLTYCSNHFK